MVLEQESIKSQHLGQDGFYWFIGQVVIDSAWRNEENKETNDYGYRAKVRIIGKHPATNDIKDDELPWAHFLLPPTFGSGVNHYGFSNFLQGGETVFGFFLDGIEAQQPVIFGSLAQHKNMKNFIDWDEVEIAATSGFSPIRVDSFVTGGLGTTTKVGGSDVSFEGGTIPDNNDQILASNGQKVDTISKIENNKVVKLTKAAECSTPSKALKDMGGALGDLMKVLQKLEKTKAGYIDPVLNTVVNIDKLVDYAAKKMAGSLSNVIANTRTKLFNKIDEGISDSLDFLDPNFLAKQIGIEKAKDGIYCLLQNIMKGLKNLITKAIKSLIGKLLNFPLCAIESFLSGILGKITNDIQKAIAPLMAGIKGLIPSISLPDFGGMLGKALGAIQGLMNLLACEDSECKLDLDVELNKGQTGKKDMDFAKMIGMTNLMNKTDKGIDGMMENIFPGMTGDPGPMSELEKLAGPCNPYDPETCQPPSVQFFGGGGIGAFGQAVVNEIGQVVGVDMKDLGFGYTETPYVSFVDNCDNGRGATGIAVVEDEKVVEVIMIETGDGYLGSGSTGGEEVVGVIDGADVISTGTGYQPTDTVSTDDGCVMTPEVVNGRIVGLKGSCPMGGGLSALAVNSSTGYGAVLRPRTKFVPVKEYASPSVPSTSILTVVDCPRGV